MRTKVTTYTETINPIYPEQGNERKVTDMSVAELRSVIREIVREEIAMQHFTAPMPMPIQPWYQEMPHPYKPNEVWCKEGWTASDNGDSLFDMDTEM